MHHLTLLHSSLRRDYYTYSILILPDLNSLGRAKHGAPAETSSETTPGTPRSNYPLKSFLPVLVGPSLSRFDPSYVFRLPSSRLGPATVELPELLVVRGARIRIPGPSSGERVDSGVVSSSHRG